MSDVSKDDCDDDCGCSVDAGASEETVPADADDGDAAVGDVTGDGDVVTVSVPDMDCPSCAGKVENAVTSLDGVQDVDPRSTTGTLTVRYDADATDRSAVVGSVEGAGYTVEDADEEATLTLDVPEMDCPSCAGKVENALVALDGVVSVDTRPASGTAVATFDGSVLSRDDVVRAVEAAGYEVVDVDGEGTSVEGPAIWTSPRGLKTWTSGFFVAVGMVLEFLLTGANVSLLRLGAVEFAVADVVFLVAVAVGGQEIVRNGYYSFKNRSLDIDLLMTIAILGALVASVVFGESLYFEAATLAFLFSVAELLERYSMEQARTSLRELADLSPDEATVKRDGEETTVPVESLVVGDVAVVRPGEKIPADGVVTEGTSAVNQAPVTGESVPVDKTRGDEVYAGTVNEEGYLEVEVTRPASESTIARVVEMVEDAQANQSEREQFVERFAGLYTPIVVAFAVVVAFGPPLALGADWAPWIVRGLTLLVLACPCAFVISTPVSVVSGVTSAARNGVLVKGGNYLEAMGEIDVVAFDKTGTLTKGELTVTDVVPLNGNDEEDVLRCARGLESRSEHPIAQAIVGHADERAVSPGQVSEFESITGKGVTAAVHGTTHYAGKPGLFEELGFDLTHVHAATEGGQVTRTSHQLCERHDCLDLLEETVPRLQSEGKTVVLVGTEDELEGVVAVADELRPEAKETVSRLRNRGLQTVMLTGDNRRTARAVADAVGVDEFHAELLPEEKVEVVETLREEGGVAMVGDGVNDAPALATATVGIAMGAAGTDTALETADVALMSDDLTRLPYLYDLAHAANRVIRQNVWTSLAVKAGLALAVPVFYVPIWVAVLVGDAGMTTAVTANAMRLSRIRAE